MSGYIYVHPYDLYSKSNLCAFCYMQTPGCSVSVAREGGKVGWRVCEKEECRKALTFCLSEYKRRESGRPLGNERDRGPEENSDSE